MRVLVLCDDPARGTGLEPALEMLGHTVSRRALSHGIADDSAWPPDVALLDATGDLAAASVACRQLAASEASPPVVVAVAEASLAALKATWGFDDWLLPSAQPAELETRLRLATESTHQEPPVRESSVGDLSIDERTYVVRLRGRPLDLTYREFELLKYLANNPARVFTRAQLLQQVWGYDYFGGTRTVDVHIRRLRAKMGAEYEQLIGTVRGVGYKLDPQGAQAARARSRGEDPDAEPGEPEADSGTEPGAR